MNIQSILDEFSIDYKQHGEHHHVAHGYISVDCPFCSGSTNRYHMGISISRLYCVCYKCGYHTLIETLLELTGESYGKCWGILQTIEKQPRIAPKGLKPAGRLSIPSGVQALREPHRAYLKSRKLDPEKMEKLWDVGGFDVHNRLSWRIFIPVYYQGDVVSWTTRSIGTNGKRYITAKPNECRLSLNSLLFGEDYCRHSIIITEGPFDVFRIGPGAVATCGLSYSTAQVGLMSKYPIRVVCFDSEVDAQKRARKLVRTLEPLPGDTYLVRLESGKDAGEADQDEIDELRKKFLEPNIS